MGNQNQALARVQLERDVHDAHVVKMTNIIREEVEKMQTTITRIERNNRQLELENARLRQKNRQLELENAKQRLCKNDGAQPMNKNPCR